MSDPNLIQQPETEKNTATPLRCLIGSIISGGLAIAVYSLLNAIAISFATNPIHSQNQLTIRISSAVRTLVLGVFSLGTGVFAMVTLGLFALGVQLLIQQLRQKS
ncbi:DUF3082 domain-containing protein [Scytonema hofmannii FACHB-248]|uniref:DUF3082 domain-containing protein n=1 Tax=Scytonema hofmannii FACHB-248 TaxID=1842502 RepID=A0ABR8GRP9_9CYAN|nr:MULTISPECIES: DUF3082 domain-containing protein [Nostocales]MBD2606139.1 DUF3082 domain-containing protein [Scytonema hofmannii FACHB-248]